MGRRVKKVTYYNGDVNEMTRVVYDGQQVIAEYDYNDTTAQYELARKFIHSDGIDQPMISVL